MEDVKDLSKVCAWKITDMSGLSYQRDKTGSISTWDVSNMTAVYEMFMSHLSFNEDKGNWDVSNLIYAGKMFYYAANFIRI